MIFVAERRRSIVGTGAGLLFGSTGWIGGLGVEPSSRRRGIASHSRLGSSSGCASAGAETLLLQATAQGRPVYEGLGFVAEGGYRMWWVPPARRARRRWPAHPTGSAELRPLRTPDLDAVLALDRRVTSEDRALAIRAAWSSGGVALDEEGELRGYHLDTPWGPGPTVAADRDAGLALLETAQRPDESVRVGVPEANGLAVDAMRDRGFEEVAGTERMRLGPAVGSASRPRVRVFNPFWG